MGYRGGAANQFLPFPSSPSKINKHNPPLRRERKRERREGERERERKKGKLRNRKYKNGTLAEKHLIYEWYVTSKRLKQ